MKTILLLLALCFLCAGTAQAAQNGLGVQAKAVHVLPGGETGNG